MKNSTEISVSDEVPFEVLTEENINVSPQLYERQYNNETPSFTRTDQITPPARRYLSTETQYNTYGLQVSYIPHSQELSMDKGGDKFSLTLTKKSNTVTYTTTNPDAELWPINIFFNDIVGGVAMDTTRTKVDTTTTSKKYQKQQNIYSVEHVEHQLEDVQPSRSENTWTFPSALTFSLLSNTNMYYSPSIFQHFQPSGHKEIDQTLSKYYGWYGGAFSLTGDLSAPYPTGVTLLLINNGSTGNEAAIEFNHDPLSQTVTVKVLSNRVKTCDFRNTSTDESRPTICFAV